MQYDIEKLQEANKMMQIIQYRIQTAKDIDGNYLFITWQRPWQIEVLKKINSNKEVDLDKYTKKQLQSAGVSMVTALSYGPPAYLKLFRLAGFWRRSIQRTHYGAV